jgi:hypothetical protein
MDSSATHTLLRWSREAQVSAREGLAIMVGGKDTAATRVLSVVGLMKRLPVFDSRDAAMKALEIGQRPRSERPLRWLTDLELATERDAAQTGSDAATRRLDDAVAEQTTRRRDAETTSVARGRASRTASKKRLPGWSIGTGELADEADD